MLTSRSSVSLLLGIGALASCFAACGDDDNTATNPGGDAGHDANTSPIDSGVVVTPNDAGPIQDAAPGTDAGNTADAGVDAGPAAANVLYMESNLNGAGQNTIMGYSRAANGTLTALPGSPYATGGTGVSNPMQALGPDDTDHELVVSPDHRLLFAVNGGSNNISVFNIASNGSLTAIAGSPFASGGINPGSLGLAGSVMYVVNQDGDPAQDASTGAPSYTVLNVAANGALSPLATSTVAAGASPSDALLSPDGKFLFGADFLAPLSPAAANPLRSFVIGADHRLTNAPGTPMAIPVVAGGTPPGTPAALGLAVHPTQHVLYVGFVLRSQIGVYTYDDTTGALTYQTEAAVSGAAPCWIRANTTGNRLYVTDTATNSVSVLDSTNAMAPVELQHFVLADLGPTYGAMNSPTSESYQEALSPDGKLLYVVSENTNPDLTVTGFNVLHILSVATDGTLTETIPDVKLAVPAGTRPDGVVVF